MRRSFVRLVVRSVLATWTLGFVVGAVYVFGRSWDEDAARGDGIFLIHQLLDRIPASERAARLPVLQENTEVDLAIVTVGEVEGRVGRRVRRGERIPLAVSAREAWYFVVFDDGLEALAAGPVDPAVPKGAFPIGLLYAFVVVPLIVGAFALRMEHSFTNIERVSRAIAIGELGARVDESRGPSEEFAVRFNTMADRVERLVRSRDELVQAVSHELGSPLSRLRFHLELLEREPEEQRGERLAAMSRELDALDELVTELLGYAQSDDMEVRRQVFDPGNLVADLAELARLELPDDQEFVIEVGVPEGLKVDADPRLFQRAVENVLRNAVRHARSRVRVEGVGDSEAVRIAIHDDGPGIPEDLREKVVTPFFRVATDRGRHTGGAGLGLAIVDRIVSRHGGHVEIARSSIGGALVTTVWPRTSGPHGT